MEEEVVDDASDEIEHNLCCNSTFANAVIGAGYLSSSETLTVKNAIAGKALAEATCTSKDITIASVNFNLWKKGVQVTSLKEFILEPAEL